jgi:hypothetical protein
MKSGCFVSAACACVHKEMSKINMEGTVNASLWPRDVGEVLGKRVVGLFAELMCLLS